MKDHEDTKQTLAGRDDLSREELLALAEAREATRPREEALERDGWRVTLSHHLHTHGRWYATATPLPNPDYSEVVLAGPVDEATARAVAVAFLDAPGERGEKLAAARAAGGVQ